MACKIGAFIQTFTVIRCPLEYAKAKFLAQATDPVDITDTAWTGLMTKLCFVFVEDFYEF